MEKTLQEWYNELPEPYKSKAIEAGKLMLHHKEPSLMDALTAGFIFMDTPDGSEYWCKLCNEINEREAENAIKE